MFGSLRIATIAGIPIRLHWLFIALVAILVGSTARPWQWMLLDITLLFGVVVLHELGHCLVARRFGIRVLDITLWPLGGMARMSEIPESSKVEGLVAIAGPGVNFVLAPIALLVYLASGGSPIALGMFDLGAPIAESWITHSAGKLFAINFALGVFNLLPAFPMDGGRVLRALFGLKWDWMRATELAVKVGRFFAVALMAIAVAFMVIARSPFAGLGPGLIGLFVWWAGTRELWAMRVRHGRIPFGPMAGRPMPDAFGAAFSGRGPFANAPGAPPSSPFVARASPVEQSGDPRPPSDEPGDAESGARRPVVEWRGSAFGRERVTEDTIARLERFRGRLHQRPDAAE